MFRYAQLDSNNVVVAISNLGGEVIADNMILINDLEVELELGSTYDRTTNTFTPPVSVPVEPKPTIEQQILAELQYNTALTEMKALGGM